MGVVRVAVLMLVCSSLTGRECLPLLADHLESLLSHSSSHQDPHPAPGSELPAPIQESPIEGPSSDCADETFSFLTPPSDPGPIHRLALRDRAHPRVASSGELLDALHRLRI
jgi:hypothetical protein